MKTFFSFLTTLFLLFISSLAYGQQKTGIEWINTSKKYYKLKVAENAIFRVTYEDLLAAGWSHGQVAAGDLRLINYGSEQAIHVSSTTFGPGSWFEFYGEKNTIGLDSLLYKDWKKDLLNPEYSFVTDTNAYFLTLSPETINSRYTQVNPDYSNSNLSPVPYYLHTEKVVYSSEFFKNTDGDVRNSYFEPSEGFASGAKQSTSTVLPTSSFVDSGPQPVLSFRVGQNNQQAKLEISWNGQLKESVTTLAKTTNQYTYLLDKSEISGNNTLGLKNVLTTSDRHIISYASLTYPRAFTFGNKPSWSFSMNASSTKRLLEISDFNTEGTEVYLYDFKNKLRYATGKSGNKVLAIINPMAKETSYVLTNSITGYKNVTDISVFNPRSFEDRGSDYIIISNKNLYAFGPDYVQEYADYRSSPEGGSYKTEIIEIGDIYNHFGYGIDRHFVSVKNMAKYIKDQWQSARFVMVIGKGLEYPLIRKQNDVLNNVNKTFFIPTFGYAGSDNMLFSEANYPDPYFAIGRLAARTPEDIVNYLDKVKQYELALKSDQTIEAKYWTKRVLHLGGGKTDFEQNSIQNGLNSMASILSDTIYGADVKSYFKNTFDAVQFSVNEEISHLFENGVAIINFFGHSASTTWDFSIQNPKYYNNYGKYPMINSFGCYSGNLHGLGKGISESFVLEKDKGSISFFASTGTAFISSLSSYGYRFYDAWLNKLRYKTVGEVITYLAKQNRNSQFAELALYAQLTYHGDPVIKMYIEKQPDYTFDGSSVKIQPSLVQASLEEFEVKLDVVNLGTYQLDSVNILFRHLLPNGKLADSILINVPGIANTHKVTVKLKNYGQASVGKNLLYAIVDPDNKILEGPIPDAENNNELFLNGTVGYEFFVTDNLATTIYPPNFAMINTQEHIVLKASTSTVPLPQENFVFQIDTTAYFNSPLLESAKVQSNGGLMTYKPLLQAVDGRVYYWRVSPDSTSAEGYKWSSASFAYLPQEDEGWNQSHFFQFKQNTFEDLEITEGTERKFSLGKEYFNIKLKNKLWDINDQPGFIFSNVTWHSAQPWRYMDSGVGIVVNNHYKTLAYINEIGGSYGSFNPTGDILAAFAFKTDTPDERKKVIDFLEFAIQKGYYLHFYTIQKTTDSDYKPKEWSGDSILFGKSIFSVLEKFGAKKVRELEKKGSVPYALQLEYGNSDLYDEAIATGKFDIIETQVNIFNYKTSGQLSSTPIGKAKKWSSIKYKLSEISNTNENLFIDIFGLNQNETEEKIFSNIQSGISLSPQSDIFSNLKLKSFVFDSLEKTAPQLDYWRVSYDPLPDAAISFVKSEPDPSNNELRQGEKVKIYYDVTNVNFVAMDSILVKYSYIDNNNQEVSAFKKLGKLGPGQKISDNIEFAVLASNSLEIRFVIEINPGNVQPELHHFNNVLTKKFDISRDEDNPLLDVYFDGIHIMDGDIVSPKPEILITLEDDNTLLPVTDPNLFEIKLDTGRNQTIDIPMNSPQISFTPAGNGNKTARVLFTPTLKEGDYKLIVQAKDASGNKSGINPRIISFRVIERQSVSNVLNYPNPFSTSTQFIFTLTGAEVPDVMSVSIMTISGKVVREITKEQLGPLHIGVNRTDYRWDGTDEYGSKLANGVYLYKVNVRKSDGSLYDNFSNNDIDSYFTKGFGKLVILR